MRCPLTLTESLLFATSSVLTFDTSRAYWQGLVASCAFSILWQCNTSCTAGARVRTSVAPPQPLAHSLPGHPPPHTLRNKTTLSATGGEGNAARNHEPPRQTTKHEFALRTVATHPSSPSASQRGWRGRLLPIPHSNSIHARSDNVSHSARGGVENHHDAIERAPAHARRSPLHPRCWRNGGSGDLRLVSRPLR